MLLNLETDNNETDYESVYSSSTYIPGERSTTGEQAQLKDSDLGDYFDTDLSLACQTKKDASKAQSRPATSKNELEGSCAQCKDSNEPFYHVNLNTILKLKESTKKLLCVLEEIQSKTHAKNEVLKGSNLNLSKYIKPIPGANDLPAVTTDNVSSNALKRLETQAKALESIYIQDEDDDCSIYKRLTRKCNCLNQHNYNDFVIHFNEETKYRTSVAGEIIKNMRILKKFLYMNGQYTKNALLFLNEGFTNSTITEKTEITQGCAYADMCNVFEEHSIVTTYIAWPFKGAGYGDAITQALAAEFLYKLTQLEEGRKYLNFSSIITNDIKKLLRKKSSALNFDTLEYLNATLNLLNPPLTQNINVTYYCKPIDEGMGKKAIDYLVDQRQYMTLNEVFTHLQLIQSLSYRDKGKFELTTYLPTLLSLLKRLLIEYDNSEMNIVVTNILNNIVSKNMVKDKKPDAHNDFVITDVGTEPILMKNEINQFPSKKGNSKKNRKSSLGVAPTTKYRSPTRRKVPEYRTPSSPNWLDFSNRSKFSKGNIGNAVIVVPFETKAQ